MKRVLILTMIILLTLIGVVCAENIETSRGNYKTSYQPLTNFLNNNNCFLHSHMVDIPTYDNPFGFGADVKIYEFPFEQEKGINAFKKPLGFLDSFNTEYRYDSNNQSHSVFFVLSVDISNLFKK